MLLLLGLLLLWIAAVCMVAHGLRHPPRKTYAWAVSRQSPGSPADIVPQPTAWEEWEFTHTLPNTRRSHVFKVWDIAGNKPDGTTVIITPGWSDSKWVALSRVPALLPECSRILLWDPPGLGDTSGACVLGAREYQHLVELVSQTTRPEDRVMLFGWSMGAGISIATAAALCTGNSSRVAGVIAEAPYIHPQTPAINVLNRRELPGSILVPGAIPLAGFQGGTGVRWPGFSRVELARQITCPLLVLHGTKDEICPLSDGKAIADAASHGQLITIPDGRHMDLWTHPDHLNACSEAVSAFLRSLDHNKGKPHA